MYPETRPPPGSGDDAGNCGCSSCPCCGLASVSPDARHQLLKRKVEELDAEVRSLSAAAAAASEGGVARVEIGNEAAALREALASHQTSLQDLYTELEEERRASSSAATEALSMILRLQHEKAEAQMEVSQFKRLAEEKMAHDQQEIEVLEDLLFKREQALQSLSCEVQAYRHRLLSYGIALSCDSVAPSEPQTPCTATSSAAAAASGDYASAFDYPPVRLRCTIPETEADVEDDIDKYPFGETPRDRLQKIDERIHGMGRTPCSVKEKVIVGYSPRWTGHLRRFSVDSFGSGLEFNNGEEFPSVVDNASDWGASDDICVRVYTIDSVHELPAGFVDTPREAQNQKLALICRDEEETEISKMNKRLQALEDDRECMRKAMITVDTDKAQAVLLKEIALLLSKEAEPERRTAKKQSHIKSFSFISVVKSAISFIFWRKGKRLSPIKYTFGLSRNNAGLLLLLDRSPCLRHRRFLTRTRC